MGSNGGERFCEFKLEACVFRKFSGIVLRASAPLSLNRKNKKSIKKSDFSPKLGSLPEFDHTQTKSSVIFPSVHRAEVFAIFAKAPNPLLDLIRP